MEPREYIAFPNPTSTPSSKKKKKLSNQNPTKMQGFYAKRDSSLLHSPIISSISDPSEVPKSTCSPAVAKLYSDGGNPLLLYSFLICSSCFRPRDEAPPPPLSMEEAAEDRRLQVREEGGDQEPLLLLPQVKMLYFLCFFPLRISCLSRLVRHA